MPPLVSSQATVGSPLTSMIWALDALPVWLIPPAVSELPSATQPPAPPFAVGSYSASLMLLLVPDCEVQATIGCPLASSAIAGSAAARISPLIPPPCALPASWFHDEPASVARKTAGMPLWVPIQATKRVVALATIAGPPLLALVGVARLEPAPPASVTQMPLLGTAVGSDATVVCTGFCSGIGVAA